MRVRGEEKVKSLSISRVEPPEASHSHSLATVVGLLVSASPLTWGNAQNDENVREDA